MYVYIYDHDQCLIISPLKYSSRSGRREFAVPPSRGETRRCGQRRAEAAGGDAAHGRRSRGDRTLWGARPCEGRGGAAICGKARAPRPCWRRGAGAAV